MDDSVQEAVRDLITALIRSLGSSNPALLDVLKQFPPGSESLALRVVTIFTSNQRPSAPFVGLVKSLVTEKDLGSDFIVPIIAQMDKVGLPSVKHFLNIDERIKADIVRHLPKIVSTLNGTPEQKQHVRSVFQSVVQMPSETFGSVSTNLPRVRQTELLMPVELMVLLHNSEKEIGLKSTIEGKNSSELLSGG
jgi:symplekin